MTKTHDLTEYFNTEENEQTTEFAKKKKKKRRKKKKKSLTNAKRENSLIFKWVNIL